MLLEVTVVSDAVLLSHSRAIGRILKTELYCRIVLKTEILFTGDRILMCI